MVRHHHHCLVEHTDGGHTFAALLPNRHHCCSREDGCSVVECVAGCCWFSHPEASEQHFVAVCTGCPGGGAGREDVSGVGGEAASQTGRIGAPWPGRC